MSINIFISLQVIFPLFLNQVPPNNIFVRKIVRFKLASTFKFKPILFVVKMRRNQEENISV